MSDEDVSDFNTMPGSFFFLSRVWMVEMLSEKVLGLKDIFESRQD